MVPAVDVWLTNWPPEYPPAELNTSSTPPRSSSVLFGPCPRPEPLKLKDAPAEACTTAGVLFRLQYPADNRVAPLLNDLSSASQLLPEPATWFRPLLAAPSLGNTTSNASKSRHHGSLLGIPSLGLRVAGSKRIELHRCRSPWWLKQLQAAMLAVKSAYVHLHSAPYLKT
jgi:hypothetical protein